MLLPRDGCEKRAGGTCRYTSTVNGGTIFARTPSTMATSPGMRQVPRVGPSTTTCLFEGTTPASAASLSSWPKSRCAARFPLNKFNNMVRYLTDPRDSSRQALGVCLEKFRLPRSFPANHVAQSPVTCIR